jgi:hypothetical protein
LGRISHFFAFSPLFLPLGWPLICFAASQASRWGCCWGCTFEKLLLTLNLTVRFTDRAPGGFSGAAPRVFDVAPVVVFVVGFCGCILGFVVVVFLILLLWLVLWWWCFRLCGFFGGARFSPFGTKIGNFSTGEEKNRLTS